MRSLSPVAARALLVEAWTLPHDARLAYLLALAEVVVQPSQEYDEVRAEDLSRFFRQPECYVCEVRGIQLHRHHMILVKHGGDNDPWNLVSLCTSCHARVHPWLPQVPMRRVSGWWTTWGNCTAAEPATRRGAS